mmetsp:Transcript_45933/g.60875  ORF Transcript_45933/g.60875 Transcript_45933/m.60875 type:complete len:128 (+) Transcript_45933:409-792(+)|eukprot:CAMPEP_0185593746 /NCGR_PEP_ID=MMETSP0434-20130131/72496_1 /TAXON_ID=626734 ORGANISM="Favella taraikaensis, Strain Fe Narragansett Bay" /NCGR_SAMPLE_ID=MMETSP0434 /ASSEMBLY_ACC=CAM_ASM_000379 /LENGTH=127 /DNA_ID=CAMNT_0028220559 /DNA_START=383 /DNA_END=766 /DNA_ORIENTATION=+
MAICAVAEARVAMKTFAMADAIVLPTVVALAVTTFAHGFVYQALLLFTSSDSLWPFVVEASNALAHARLASNTLLEAHAVELSTVATLAVAALERALELALPTNRVKLLADSLRKTVRCITLIDTAA